MGSDPKPGRFGVALRTINHGLTYARHLAKGNRFTGDVSWIRPGSLPVLLAHGFLGTRGTMLPMTKRFQSDGRVVFSYHHGTFQLQSMRASAQELVEQLASLERSLGLSRFDVVGFSMGGLVALHAVKFLQAGRWIRRLALLGTPLDGTWFGLAGVATVGLVSPSVWQVLPASPFLNDLREAPLPDGVEVQQIHAAEDSLCPLPRPLPGLTDGLDYHVLPGGHSSLVVAKPFYARVREFFEGPSDEEQRVSPTLLSNEEYAAE